METLTTPEVMEIKNVNPTSLDLSDANMSTLKTLWNQNKETYNKIKEKYGISYKLVSHRGNLGLLTPTQHAAVSPLLKRFDEISQKVCSLSGFY